MKERAPLKIGVKFRRIKDDRRFEVTFVNWKALNVPLFSAKPLDGKWSWDGGPIPYTDEIEVMK